MITIEHFEKLVNKYSFEKSVANDGIDIEYKYSYFVYNKDNYRFFRYIPDDYSIFSRSKIGDIFRESIIHTDIKIFEKYLYTSGVFSEEQNKIYMRYVKIGQL